MRGLTGCKVYLHERAGNDLLMLAHQLLHREDAGPTVLARTRLPAHLGQVPGALAEGGGDVPVRDDFAVADDHIGKASLRNPDCASPSSMFVRRPRQCAPGRIRTCGQQIRSLSLYPAELRGLDRSRTVTTAQVCRCDTSIAEIGVTTVQMCRCGPVESRCATCGDVRWEGTFGPCKRQAAAQPRVHDREPP